MCQELRNSPFLTCDLSTGICWAHWLSKAFASRFYDFFFFFASLEKALRSPPFPLIIPTKCCQWSVLRSLFPVQAILNCLLWGSHLSAWVVAGMSVSCWHPLLWHVASGFGLKKYLTWKSETLYMKQYKILMQQYWCYLQKTQISCSSH